MQDNKVEYYSLKDIVNKMSSYLQYIKIKWWLIPLSVIVGGILGAIFFSVQRANYQAECTFILEEKQSGIGGLGSLASQFGIEVGGMGGNGLFAGDNILEILKSKKIVKQVLLGRSDSAQDAQTLADLYMAFSGIKRRWSKKPFLTHLNFRKPIAKLSPVEDSVLNVIYESILKKNLSTERGGKQSTIIRVKVNSENGLFSRLMAERLVEEASRLYLDIRTGTAVANITRMQNRSDSLLLLLNRKSYTAASVQPLDINPGIKTAVVPTEIASRDKSVIAALYTEVTKNLETSKMLLSQQTPVIQVLDRPGVLLENRKKSLVFFTVIFSVAALVIYLVVAAVVYFFTVVKTDA